MSDDLKSARVVHVYKCTVNWKLATICYLYSQYLQTHQHVNTNLVFAPHILPTRVWYISLIP